MATKQEKVDMLIEKMQQADVSMGNMAEVLDWVVDNWSLDLTTATTYLAAEEAKRKTASIVELKAQLKRQGETDPYLNT